jgi:hypothetical protein
MAENRTWAVEDRLLYTNGEDGEQDTGTVVEIDEAHGSQIIRIKWDDGTDDDNGWWSANDSELTKLASSARERLNGLITYLPLLDDSKRELRIRLDLALAEAAQEAMDRGMREALTFARAAGKV